MGKIAEVLGLPSDYFPEYRELYVVEWIRSDSKLRDELYARLKRRRSPGRRARG
jgi:hypothetical protein